MAIRRWLPRLALVLLFGAAHVPAEPLPDQEMRSGELETFVDGVMASEFASRKLAGAAVVVVRDGAVLLEKGYGFSDLERRVPVDPGATRFTVGSISKLIVWTAVMQLVERGELDLDADVNTYLVKFRIPPTFPAPITMRHLMTHTAGFEDVGTPFAPEIFRASPSLGDFLAAHLPARAMPPARDFMHAALPYSNWGSLLAAHVVECISGSTFRDYAARHIFAPLGMSSTGFSSCPAHGSQALGYTSRNGALTGQCEDMSASGPAGAVTATADDIGRFMIAHLGGGPRILGAESLQLMHRRSAQSSALVDGVALGFMDAEMNGRRVLRHDGSTWFTHSELLLIPSARVGFFVTFNSVEGGYARRDVRKAFVDRYFPAGLAQPSAYQKAGQDIGEYAGRYRSLRRSFTTFEKLFGSIPIAVRALPNGRLLIAGDQWTQIAPDVFRNALGERIGFGREDGRVVSVSLKSSLAPARRISWYEDPRYHALLLLATVASAVLCILRAVRRARTSSRRTLAVIGLLNICTLFLLGSVFAAGIAPIMTDGIPTRLRVGLALGMLSAALTVIALISVASRCVRRAEPVRSAAGQLGHVALALGFVALLQYWNLLGFHLG